MLFFSLDTILSYVKTDFRHFFHAIPAPIHRYKCRCSYPHFYRSHTGYRDLEVRSEGVLCENADHEQVLVPGTSVICALGQRSRSKLTDSLRDCAPYVAIIGDVSRVSTITNAVYDGYHAALDI